MRRCIAHREFIPKSDTPAAMPKGLTVRYFLRGSGSTREITPERFRRIMKNLRSGRWPNIWLSGNEDLEVDIMELESGGGLYALQYILDNTGASGEAGAWWSTYDPEFLDTWTETDIEPADGQSILYRDYTTADREAVMTAIEYFIRTGKLWDGIPWIKGWSEWVDEPEPEGIDGPF